MRALASNGLLKQNRDGRFDLTRVGQALRSDVPDSMVAMLLFIGHPKHWEHWGQLLYSVQTGKTSAEMLRGKPIFEYLEIDRDLADVFNNAMTGVSSMAIESLMPAYDFTRFGTIVDVGPNLTGDRTLDASGCVVSPGFVDGNAGAVGVPTLIAVGVAEASPVPTAFTAATRNV